MYVKNIIVEIDGYIAKLEVRREELVNIISTNTIEREIAWAIEEREDWEKLLS